MTVADITTIAHLHPRLAVVGRPPRLVHLDDGWEDPLPGESLAAALRHLTTPSTIAAAVLASGCAAGEEDDLRSQLVDLRDQRIILDGTVPAATVGMFAAPTETLGAALAHPGADAVIVGMPYDVGTTVRAGTRAGPRGLREVSGAAMALAGSDGVFDPRAGRRVLEGRRIVDVGDVEAAVHTRNGITVDRLGHLVRWITGEGALAVVIGGDHSIAHAVTSGCGRSIGEHTVVQLDAHTDRGGDGGPWREDLHHGNVGDHLLADPTVARLVQVGVRQRTPHEPPSHPAVRVLPAGAVDLAERTVEALPPDLPVHLSIDVDVFDPTVVAGTGAPVPGGLGLAEVVSVIEAVAAARPVVAVDICELIPDDDLPGTLAVAEMLVRLLVAVLDPVTDGAPSGSSR